jgi:hypothetical protein
MIMLFENRKTTITAEQVASQLLQKANRQFSRELEDAKSDFNVVWNRGDGLTGWWHHYAAGFERLHGISARSTTCGFGARST